MARSFSLGVFLNGLKEEIKFDVRIHKPKIVYRSISLVLEFENKLGIICSNGESNWTLTSRSTIQNSLHSSINTQNNIKSSLQNQQNNASPNPSTSQPLWIQTWETEKRNLIAQALCYRCHDKFSLDHKGKFVKLSLVELTCGYLLEDVDWVNAKDYWRLLRNWHCWNFIPFHFRSVSWFYNETSRWNQP